LQANSIHLPADETGRIDSSAWLEMLIVKMINHFFFIIPQAVVVFYVVRVLPGTPGDRG